jgi:hypothetical protein
VCDGGTHVSGLELEIPRRGSAFQGDTRVINAAEIAFRDEHHITLTFGTSSADNGSRTARSGFGTGSQQSATLRYGRTELQFRTGGVR